LAGFKPCRGLDSLAGDAHLAFAYYLVDMRQRQFRETPLEPAVEAHPRLVFAHIDERDLVAAFQPGLRFSMNAPDMHGADDERPGDETAAFTAPV
jgi:hypothetical protein